MGIAETTGGNPGHCDQQKCDDHIHQWPGDGDQQFLHRLVGHSVHIGNAADGRQNDVRSFDAEAPAHQDMSELVQGDAGKHQNDENQRVQRCRGAACRVIGNGDPGQEQQEGEVKPHRRTGDPADGD